MEDTWPLVESDSMENYVFFDKGSPVGFCSVNFMDKQKPRFFLMAILPDLIGKGYGGYFFKESLKIIWEKPESRSVWLRTSETDHPNALKLYTKSGMRIVKEVIEQN